VTASGHVPPRLPLVETPEDPVARELFDGLAAGSRLLNLHRMMAHAPALMKASGDLALAFRRDTMLPRDLAELVILWTAQIVDCEYVWSRHLTLARACGVTERQIEELGRWPDSAAFTRAQKAALGFAQNAAERTPVGDEAFAALRRDFSPREIVEITMLVGFYVSTAILIKALAVPPEKA
jgi:AhpD family alkylhydroperoxidase